MNDLNVLWSNSINPKGDPQFLKSLAILQEFGYSTVAVNHLLSGKFSSSHKSPIDLPHLRSLFPSLKILSRVTVIADDTLQQNLAPLALQYDIVAIRPLSERALQNVTATGSDTVDIISLDCSKRIPFFLRHKTICAGVERGLKFEIVYASATVSSDSRKHIITNAASLIRSSRKRGLIISSESSSPLSIRGPYDVINLACLWGLDHMRAHEAIGKTAGLVVKNSYLRANSYKQAIVASPIDGDISIKKRASDITNAQSNKRQKSK